MNNSTDDFNKTDELPNIWNNGILFGSLFIKAFVILLTIFLNLCIILIIRCRVKQKTYTNYLFLSMSTADCLVGAVSMVCMTIYTSYGYWPLGYHLCAFWIILDYSSCSISLFNLLIITIHRYRILVSPYKVNEDLSKKRYFKIFFVWFVAFTFLTASVLPITSQTFVEDDCYFMYTFLYVILSDSIIFTIPIFGLVIMNILTVWALNKKMKRVSNKFIKSNVEMTTFRTHRVRFDESCNNTIAVVNGSVTFNKRRSTLKPTGTSHKDRKAVSYLVSASFTLIFTWIIFIVTWPLKAYCGACVDNILYEIGYWLAYFNSTINPILLLIFHKNLADEFRKEVLKLYKFIKSLFKML